MSESRFHNLSTAELLDLEVQSRRDRKELLKLIQRRFEVESGLEVGKVYRVRDGRFAGRLMLISSVHIGGSDLYDNPLYPRAEGVLDNRTSKARDSWTILHQQVPVDYLDPTPIEGLKTRGR